MDERSWKRFWRGLVVLGLGMIPGQGEASSIHGHRLIVVSNEDSLGPAWARFLAGGASYWDVARPPRFPSDLVLPKNSNGTLVETPFVDYLTWRRDLDPSRFDHYHPNVGPELAQLTTPSVVPSVVKPVPPTKPFNVAPQNLPEPASLPLALILFGAAYAWRERTG